MADDKTDSRFRDVIAIHDSMPPNPPHLLVRGEYRLNMRSGGVEIREAAIQGINPEILILDLVKVYGNGGDWLAFEFRRDMPVGTYSAIMIADDDGETVSAKIENAS